MDIHIIIVKKEVHACTSYFLYNSFVQIYFSYVLCLFELKSLFPLHFFIFQCMTKFESFFCPRLFYVF